MNKIKKYAEHISDELDGAKEYIEKALDYKLRGDSIRIPYQPHVCQM